MYAVLRNYFQEEFEIELAEESNVSDALNHLEKMNPKASQILNHSLPAIDDEMSNRFAKLKSGQMLCILPPVSGG